jgi:hypothetical protein
MAAGQPPTPVMMKFNCVNCKGPVEAPQPILRFFNAADVSTIISMHNKAYKCPECGLAYICLIHPGLDPEGKLIFVWQPIQTQASAIAPGTDSNLKQAVETNSLASKIKIN